MKVYAYAISWLPVGCFQQTRESWQIVFIIAAAVNSFGAIMFIVLAAGVIQPWAVDPVTPEITLETNSVDNSLIYRPRESEDSGKTLLSRA